MLKQFWSWEAVWMICWSCSMCFFDGLSGLLLVLLVIFGTESSGWFWVWPLVAFPCSIRGQDPDFCWAWNGSYEAIAPSELKCPTWRNGFGRRALCCFLLAQLGQVFNLEGVRLRAWKMWLLDRVRSPLENLPSIGHISPDLWVNWLILIADLGILLDNCMVWLIDFKRLFFFSAW